MVHASLECSLRASVRRLALTTPISTSSVSTKQSIYLHLFALQVTYEELAAQDPQISTPKVANDAMKVRAGGILNGLDF